MAANRPLRVSSFDLIRNFLAEDLSREAASVISLTDFPKDRASAIVNVRAPVRSGARDFAPVDLRAMASPLLDRL